MHPHCASSARLALLTLASLSFAAAQQLVINELSRKPAAVIYELPDPEGREDAVRYIERVRSRAWPTAGMLDATAASEAALRQGCQLSCVLYTTLGEKSRLVRLATPNMGWEVRDGLFRWQDVAVPLAEARFILAARNPYADGHIAVYAAGSNRALVGINGVFHGPASFHIFQGTTLVKEGSYGADLAYRDRISKAQALEDTGQFFATLERVHPNLLAKLSKADYAKLRRQTVEGIEGKLNAKEQVAIEDLASLLYYAAASFQDGHTSVNWRAAPTPLNAAGRRFPPFRLGFDNGRFVIVAAADTESEGAELVAIDNVPVLDFLRPILERCSGETLVFRAARFIGDQPFWFYLTNPFAGAGSVRLTLRDAGGHERQTTAATLSAAEYGGFLVRTRADRPRPNQLGTAVEFLEGGAAAHLMYQSFHFSDAEKKKIDEIFIQIRARGSRDLILDLRGNGGGNSAMGDYIFSYLHAGSFRQFSAVNLKISPEVRKYIHSKKAQAMRDGVVVRQAVKEARVPRPEAFFAGRKYLLIDNGTFSSGSGFAAMFRDYHTGTILGYETGGLPTSFGDVCSFTLKNSGIPCGVSWKQFFGPKPRKGDDQHGVLPDVPMDDKLLATFSAEPDPVLAATLRYLREHR